MVWPAIIMGAATVASAALSYVGSQQQNQAAQGASKWQQRKAAEEAEKARAFGAAQSATSYQRAMADMRASGLNPILAYKQGGAGTPPAPAAGAQAWPVVNELEGAVPSAIQMLTARAQLKQAKAQLTQTKEGVKQTRAQTRNIHADTGYKKTLEWKTFHEQVKAGNDAAASVYGPGTAKSIQGLKAVELERLTKYGGSGTGQFLFSIEQMLDRMRKSKKNKYPGKAFK